MASYHMSIKIIGRSAGRSSVGASAYRAGEKLTNEYDGVTHNYLKKGGVVYSEIVLPENAPKDFQDRNTLWNAVEKIEKRKDAQTAREVEVALPKELNRDQQIQLISAYVVEAFVVKGMCADIAMHDKGDENPHAHIMLTTREVSEEGFGKKNREWNNHENTELWRKQWAQIQNQALEWFGSKERVDHKSYERQGIVKLPTIHLGPAAKQIEKRGKQSERGKYNEEVKELNAEYHDGRQALEAEIEEAMQLQKRKEIASKQETVPAHRQEEYPTAAEMAEKINALKSEYVKIELKIYNYQKQKPAEESTEKETNQINGKIEDIKEKNKNIGQLSRQIENLQYRRSKLGIFSGKKKQAIDKQIKEVEDSKTQAIQMLRNDYGITPGESAAKIQELQKQAQRKGTKTLSEWKEEIVKKETPASEIKNLRKQQGIIADQYKQEFQGTVMHPEREKIIELISARLEQPRSIGERMAAAQAESKMNEIITNEINSPTRKRTRSQDKEI